MTFQDLPNGAVFKVDYTSSLFMKAFSPVRDRHNSITLNNGHFLYIHPTVEVDLLHGSFDDFLYAVTRGPTAAMG